MSVKNILGMSSNAMLIIQYSALIMTIVGAFFVPWTLTYVATSGVFFYIYSIVGVSMMLHRYWSHRGFEFRNRFVRAGFVFISVITSRGSPLAWAHIHRDHHRTADTDSDPHKPTKFSMFSFKTTYIKNFRIFLVKDLLITEQKIIHEYYLLFVMLWCLFLLIVNPALLYFAWALPVCLNQVSQDVWNYFSHVDVGYRNFDTTDNSRNVALLWPLIFGEAWHNNHHKNPKLTTKIKWWEFDPAAGVISLIKKP